MTSASPGLNDLLEGYKMAFERVNQSLPDRPYPGHEKLIEEFMAITDPTLADQFFQKYGPGNTIGTIHLPFERQLAYETLLVILKEADPVQYAKIHKGTPYYFIGWLCYQYFNIRKAIFYLDAAVSEDLKFPEVQAGKATRPSLEFFLLEDRAGPTGLPEHMTVRVIIEKTLQEYHQRGGQAISLADFRSKFLKDLLYGGASSRSIITALFTFLLEYSERETEIHLRSDNGGSTQPFLDHLFDGARLTETLLKQRGGGGDTLGEKIRRTPTLGVTRSLMPGGKLLQDAEPTYLQYKAASESFQDCHFAATYIIRNTTGHSIDWPDQFATLQSYEVLYHCLVDSILWTVEKLWL